MNWVDVNHNPHVVARVILKVFVLCDYHMIAWVFLSVNICSILKEVNWKFISFKGNTLFCAQSAIDDHYIFLFFDISQSITAPIASLHIVLAFDRYS